MPILASPRSTPHFYPCFQPFPAFACCTHCASKPASRVLSPHPLPPYAARSSTLSLLPSTRASCACAPARTGARQPSRHSAPGLAAQRHACCAASELGFCAAARASAPTQLHCTTPGPFPTLQEEPRAPPAPLLPVRSRAGLVCPTMHARPPNRGVVWRSVVCPAMLPLALPVTLQGRRKCAACEVDACRPSCVCCPHRHPSQKCTSC